MPYIDRTKRKALEPALQPILDAIEDADEGELNYVLTSIVNAWLPDEPRYADLSRALTAFECAKLEFYRQRMAKHEDAAKALHGPLPMRRRRRRG